MISQINKPCSFQHEEYRIGRTEGEFPSKSQPNDACLAYIVRIGRHVHGTGHASSPHQVCGKRSVNADATGVVASEAGAGSKGANLKTAVAKVA